MVFISVNLHCRGHLTKFPIHTHIDKTLFPNRFKKFFIMPLTITNKRSQNIQSLSEIIGQNKAQYLVVSIFYHRLTGDKAISHTDSCI